MIQTFPESFILEGNKTDIEQIIGNAVPVRLAEYVATRLKEYLFIKGVISQELIKNRINGFPLTPKYQRRIAALKSFRKALQNA